MHRISPNVILEVSKDGLKGYITLLDKESEGISVSIDSQDIESEVKPLDKLIEEIKDVFTIGLIEEKLRQILINKYYNKQYCIAEGIAPIHGIDGYINYYFDLEKKLLPKVLTDGTVNYRELNSINNVTKGDVLAELVPPKAGKPGQKVNGQIIPFRKGKCPVLRYGKNVKLLEDGITLIADKDGLVEFRDKKVIVSDIFEVENVDKMVGNIYFNGMVMVKGNVLNGYTIKANGDIKIKGILEGAYIENKGDVIVGLGVQGYNRQTIKSTGNVVTKFIENAIINAGKTVTAEVIMHSCIYSRENIMLIGKKGLIAGGMLRAGKEIHAKTIGSSMATKTIIEVGIDPEILEKNEQLKQDIMALQKNLNKVDSTINLLDRLKKADKLDEKKIELYIKLVATKNSLINQLKKLENEYQISTERLGDVSKGRIRISDTIYPGVRIIIGNSIMVVRDKMQRCTVFRDEGEIKVGPY